tara:strand:+ start:596 stop:1327 length:732 start_codon:yes stop_codon:yes gene_type:complete
MDKKKLISEELKRHMELLEYTFYMEDKPAEDEVDNLLLGAEKLYEQDPVPAEDAEEETTEDPFGGGSEDTEGGEEETLDLDTEEGTSETDPFGGEEGMEVEDEFATEEGGEETVEVDVTDIVDKAEQTRTEIEGMTAKMDELLGKLGDLEGKVGDMDQVIDKIDGLEKEIADRNPTPVERLEMRSMDSFPYSVSLTDYWTDKEGYDVGGEEKEEFVITQKDVDDYSATEIKDSFDYNKNDENS